jgi:hypothetical protein
MRVDRLLGEYHRAHDGASGRRRLRAALEQRRGAAKGDEFQAIRRGWFFGEEESKRELLARMPEKTGPSYYGEAVQEGAEAKAERVVREELKRRKWGEDKLARRRKGDAGKVAIAQRLRGETTVTLAWIAARLQMGTKTHLAHLLYGSRRNKQ